MRRALHRIAHDGGGIGGEVADIAITRAHSIDRVHRAVATIDGGIVGAAVIGPGNAPLIESIADRPDTAWRDRGSLGDPAHIDDTIGQKTRIGVVEHVIVILLAIRARPVAEGSEIMDDRRYPRRLEHVGAITEAPVQHVVVDGARLWIGVGDLPSGWHSRAAVAVTPVEIVAGAEKDVLDAGPAHRRPVVIVADRILVGQSLEEWRVPALHIVESHGRAAAV